MSLLNKIRFSFLYWKKPPWDTQISPPELISFIMANKPGHALDLGCGTGTNAIELASNGWEVTGIDFISKPIKAARKKALKAGVKVDFINADVVRLENVQSLFDLILDIGCYHSLDADSRNKYRKNIENILVPGGTFLLYAFISEDPTNRGVSDKDIEAFGTFLELVDRQNGSDHNRPSTWFTFVNTIRWEQLR